MLFLFVNTDQFCCRPTKHAAPAPRLRTPSQCDRRKLPACPTNIRFLPGIQGDAAKARYIRTCDAMLHARKFEETFGLSVAEFASYDRPVFTKSYEANERGGRYHLLQLALGHQAILYNSSSSLAAALLSFNRSAPVPPSSTRPYAEHRPENVTRIFYEVFLRGT